MPALHLCLLHTAKLASRKPACDALLARLAPASVDATWILDHDPPALHMPTVRKRVNLDKLVDDPTYEPHVRNMHVAQVSNALKHHQAVLTLHAKAQSPQNQTHDHSYYVILEDDVLYDADTIAQALPAALQAMPADVDVWLLGRAPVDGARGTPPPPLLPSVEAYALSRRALAALAAGGPAAAPAENAASGFFPVRFPMHVQLPYLARKHGLRIARAPQPVFLDGSKVGAAISTLTPTNPLVLNPEHVQLAALVQKAEPYVAADFAQLQALMKALTYKMHPDNMLLYVQHETKMGQYKKAQAFCEKIYETVAAGGGLINSDSAFLKIYMALHKHLQELPPASPAPARAATASATA
jgi:hypothetical protein